MADSFNLGRHEGLIEQLVKGQGEIFDRLGVIEITLAERRGERRVTLWGIGALSGALGSLATFAIKTLPLFGKHS